MTDTTTPTGRDLVHAEDCPGGRVARHQSAHNDVLVCRGCAASVSVPRRSEWRMATEADQ